MRVRMTLLLLAALAAGPRVAAAASSSEPTAEEHVARAEELFGTRDYTGAARELEQAYALQPTPRILVGWAQAEKYAGNCGKSLELYDQYLAGDPPTDEVERVQPFIDECRQQVEEQAPPSLVEPLPDATDEDPPADVDDDASTSPGPDPAPAPARSDAKTRPWHRDPVGGALMGSGALFTAAGIGLIVSAEAAENRAENIRVHGEYEDALDSAILQARISYGLFAVGGALLVGGAIRYVVVARRAKRERNVAVLPAGRGIVVRGRF